MEVESLTLRLGSNTNTFVNIYKTLDITFVNIIEFPKLKKMFREAETNPFKNLIPGYFGFYFIQSES